MATTVLRLAVIGLLALAACAPPAAERASPPATSTSGSPVEPASPATSPGPGVPRELRFTEPRLGGGTVRGEDFAGHDLVMWFWAPW